MRLTRRFWLQTLCPLKDLFQNVLICPGILHVLHNAIGELLGTLQHMKTFFWPGLRSLATLLSRPDIQDRFIVRCLYGSEAASMEQQVKETHISLAHWRWGTLVHACTSLLGLRLALLHWDSERIGPSAHGDTEHNDMLAKADTACRDACWWGYLHMVLSLSGLVQHVTTWAEGCPCHDQHGRGRTTSNLVYVAPPDIAPVARPACPFSGRRAAEMAAGTLHRLCSEHAAASKHALITCHCAGLSEETGLWVSLSWKRSCAQS